MFLVPNAVVRFFHRMASPPHFYVFTELVMPWLIVIFALLSAAGLYGGLYLAPADYQQGDSYPDYIYTCPKRMDVIIHLRSYGHNCCYWINLAN